MQRLIIDGYSLLYREAEADLARNGIRFTREQLIRKIDRLAGSLAPLVELVFDGRAEGGREQVHLTGLHIIYSPGHQTADTVIERLVHSSSQVEQVCVVTSDRLERETVTAAGAQAMSCAAFLEWLDRLDREVTRKTGAPKGASGRFTLGDAFPER